MFCPYCNNDLSELENFDNIGDNECPKCNNYLHLEYDEWCIENEEGCLDCYDMWYWLKEK